MNILLLYPNYPAYTTGRYCEAALKKLGYSVETFDLLKTADLLPLAWRLLSSAGKPGSFKYLCGAFLKRLQEELFSEAIIDIREVLRNYCSRQPDIIIEVDGAGFHHLKGYKKISPPKAFWAIDVYWKLPFQRLIASDFDYIFVAQKDYIKDFYHNRVYWLPLAASLDYHKPIFDSYRIFDIGYVGQLPPYGGIVAPPKHLRARLMLLEKLQSKYNVLAVSSIYPETIAKIYSLSKIGFNRSCAGDLNMRVFEVMACGAMLLTDKIRNGIEELFVDRKHLVLYKEEELEELVEFYLNSDEERQKIAKRGQQEVYEKHSYERRMESLLKVATEQ